MNRHKGIVAALFAVVVVTGLAACEKEGPAEKAGKAIDNAANNVAEGAREMKEDIVEKAKEMKEDAAEEGKEMQESAEKKMD
ncbi:MAG TPA: hypothetical protein ENK50_06510 [Sedimenticola sp.]|nr:hypothetical protein [Sedimenticola sp.]